MTGAGISCVECSGEYEATDQPDVYLCRDCGHELTISGYVNDTADSLREYGGFDDVADWFEEQANALAGGENDA